MTDPRKILIVQLKRAGDIIVTTPALAALHEAYPQAQIDFICEKPFASLLEGQPGLKQVLIYDKKQVLSTILKVRGEAYDWIVDFQSSPRSSLLGLLSGASVRAGYQVPFWGMTYNVSVRRPGGTISVVAGKFTLLGKLVGRILIAPARKIYLTSEEKQWAVRQISGARTLGIVPTHRRDSRRWTAKGFEDVARHLLARGHQVLFFWGPGEKEYVEAIAQKVPGSKLSPPTTFRQSAALLGACELVVTNDNGPMHLAVAAGAPTLTIYGPTDPISWNPGGERHQIIQAEGLGCLGCNMNECPFGHECMTWVTPEAVVKKAEQMLNALRVPA